MAEAKGTQVFFLLPRSRISLLLDEAAENFCQAIVWTPRRSLIFETNFTVHSRSRQMIYLRLPADLDLPRFEGRLGGTRLRRECFIGLSLLTEKVFFKTLYLGNDDAGLIFRIPRDMYRVQRRKEARYTIPFGHSLKATVSDPAIEFLPQAKVRDLSAGGMTLVFGKSQAVHLYKGQKIRQVRFVLRRREIRTEITVRNLSPARGTAGMLRVGFEFTALSQEDREWIAAYILEETTRGFSRYLWDKKS